MDERKAYIFTFGSGQRLGGNAVRICGTYAEARDAMFKGFGDGWGFQYEEDEWNKTWSSPELARLMPKERVIATYEVDGDNVHFIDGEDVREHF